MNRFLPLAAILALTLGGAVAMAQTTTPGPPFAPVPLQEVIVNGYSFQVPPFYPCAAFLTERVERLVPSGISATVTIQLFIRDGEAMLPIEPPFVTHDNELTRLVPVGGVMPCAPQELLGEEVLDG